MTWRHANVVSADSICGQVGRPVDSGRGREGRIPPGPEHFKGPEKERP